MVRILLFSPSWWPLESFLVTAAWMPCVGDRIVAAALTNSRILDWAASSHQAVIISITSAGLRW